MWSLAVSNKGEFRVQPGGVIFLARDGWRGPSPHRSAGSFQGKLHDECVEARRYSAVGRGRLAHAPLARRVAIFAHAHVPRMPSERIVAAA